MSTKKPNTGMAATPEAEAERRKKISTALKAKSAKPKPLNQVAAAKKDEAFAALHILPSCISNVSELAGNPKALELAGKLAQAEKDLKAATSEVGALRARITQSDSRVAELAREKSTVELQLKSAQSNAKALEDKLSIAQVQIRNAADEKVTLAGQADKWRTCYEAETETRTKREDLLFRISSALGNKDEWDNALPLAQSLRNERDSLASDLSNLHLAHDQANANVERLQSANEVLGAEVDKLIADSPRLPLWARLLGAVVGALAIALIAHRMGFEAHASLIGGAR